MTHVWAPCIHSTHCCEGPVKVNSGELTRHKRATTSRTEAPLSGFTNTIILENTLGNLYVDLYVTLNRAHPIYRETSAFPELMSTATLTDLKKS